MPDSAAPGPLVRSASTPTSALASETGTRTRSALAGEDLVYADLDPQAHYDPADDSNNNNDSDALKRARPQLEKLRALEFVGEVNPELQCPICRCPFLSPVKLPACDHAFCADCVHQALQIQQSQFHVSGAGTLRCPLCRQPHAAGTEEAMPRAFKNLLNELRAKCLNHERGCDEVVYRRDVRIHLLDDCRYVKVHCPDDACKKPVLRRDAKKECQHEPVACAHCGETIPERQQLAQHERRACKSRVRKCEHCDRTFTDRVVFHAHICEDQVIPCPGARSGCTESLKRRDMGTHSAHCAYIKLQPTLDAQTTAIKDLQIQNRRLEERFDRLASTVRELTQRVHQQEHGRSAPPENDTPLSERQQVEFLQWQESVRAEIWREFELHKEQISERLEDMLVFREGNLRSDLQNSITAIHWLRADVDNLARIQARLLNGPGMGFPFARPGAVASSAAAPGPSAQPTRRMSDGSGRSDTKL